MVSYFEQYETREHIMFSWAHTIIMPGIGRPPPLRKKSGKRHNKFQYKPKNAPYMNGGGGGGGIIPPGGGGGTVDCMLKMVAGIRPL